MLLKTTTNEFLSECWYHAPYQCFGFMSSGSYLETVITSFKSSICITDSWQIYMLPQNSIYYYMQQTHSMSVGNGKCSTNGHKTQCPKCLKMQLLHIACIEYLQMDDQLIIVGVGSKLARIDGSHHHSKALIDACKKTKLAQWMDVLGKMLNQCLETIKNIHCPDL